MRGREKAANDTLDQSIHVKSARHVRKRRALAANDEQVGRFHGEAPALSPARDIFGVSPARLGSSHDRALQAKTEDLLHIAAVQQFMSTRQSTVRCGTASLTA